MIEIAFLLTPHLQNNTPSHMGWRIFRNFSLEGEKVKGWPVLGCDIIDKLSSS